jgi:hypothetical protein
VFSLRISSIEDGLKLVAALISRSLKNMQLGKSKNKREWN